MKIKLGNTVKDLISGFTGIAIQRLDQLNGNIQIGIQPTMKEGDTTFPDAMYIDHHNLIILDEGVSATVVEPEETNITLGQRVRCKASGFEGIATDRSIYINGCTAFAVLPKQVSGSLLNEVPKTSWIDHNRLEVVNDGLNADKPRPVVEESAASDMAKHVRPGGPAQRVHSQNKPSLRNAK